MADDFSILEDNPQKKKVDDFSIVDDFSVLDEKKKSSTELSIKPSNSLAESASALPSTSKGTTPYEMIVSDAPSSLTTSGAGLAKEAPQSKDIKVTDLKSGMQYAGLKAAEHLGEFVKEGVEGIASGLGKVKKGAEEAIIGQMTGNESQIAKGAIKATAGLAGAGISAMMHTTPIGIAWTEGIKAGEVAINTATGTDAGTTVSEYLFAPVTSIATKINGEPLTGTAEDLASIGDLAAFVLGAKGATKVIGRGDVKLSGKELNEIGKEIQDEIVKNPEQFEETAKQFGLKLKTEDQIKSEKQEPKVEVKNEQPSVVPTFEESQKEIKIEEIPKEISQESPESIETKQTIENAEQKEVTLKELNPDSKILSESHPKEDIDFVKEIIDDGWFHSTGNVYERRPDLGLSTAEVQKGIKDIKADKNTAPARKIVEEMKSVKEKGEMPMLQGTGGQTERLGIRLDEFKKEKELSEVPEMEKGQVEKIKASETIAREGITPENFDTFVKENDWVYNPEELKQVKKYLDETRKNEGRDLPSGEESVSEGKKSSEDKGAEDNRQNEEVSGELRRRIGKAHEVAGISEGAREGVDLREIDNKTAYDYAKETNTWIDNFDSLGQRFTGGNEHTIVLNKENGTLYKSNNLSNTISLNNFFDKIGLHNELFPNTAYKFEGFTGAKDTGRGKPYVEPVYSQKFIGDAKPATMPEISDYMKNNGFEQIEEFKFKKNGIEVSDIRPRNVLKDANGEFHVIDAEFKKVEEVKDLKLKSKDSIPTREEVSKVLASRRNDITKEIEKPIEVKPDIEAKNIIKSKILPLKEVMQAAFKPLAKIQDKIFGQNVSKAENWIAGKIKDGIRSQNAIKRKTSQFITNWANGLPRTEADLKQKRMLKGNIQLANEQFAENIKRLHSLVDNNVESLYKIHQVLDSDFYKEAGEKPITFDELNQAEKELYGILRKMNDYVHDYNYAMGFIDAPTYNKFKGKYIARLYEPFEVPEDVKKFMEEGNSTLNKLYKLNTDIFKAREEVNKFKKENILKDAVFSTAKRMMQTEVNGAIREYIDVIDSDKKNISDVEIKGFIQLNGKGYGKLDGKYVPNYIAEDFKGYFFANEVMDTFYDAFKLYDRNQLRQLLKKSYTIWSPGVQLGNFSSNYVFSFLSGIDPITYSNNLLKASKELTNKGDTYKTLVKNGILKSDIVTGDLIPLTEKTKSILDKNEEVSKSLLDRVKKIDEKASELYGKTDDLAKTSAFLSLKEYGFTDEQAIQKVYEGFQNYSTVGKIWDVASKTPIIGNPFVKFQADLQRIVKNAVLKRPLSTVMFLGMLKLMAHGASRWSDETEEEKELREGRKYIPKIPLPKMIGGDVPLVFQTPYGEFNLARYLSPYYIYDRGDQESAIENFSKFLPYQMQINEGYGKGSTETLPLFSDPLLGTYFSVLADKDFRGLSVQDPQSTRYKSSGITNQEKIANGMNYIARSQVPYYSNLSDMYSSWKYGTDFYGRDRKPIQAIVNNLIKVQQFGNEKYKDIIEKELSGIEFNITGQENVLKDIDATTQKDIDKYGTMLERKSITKEQYDRKIEALTKTAEEREAKAINEIAIQQQKLDDMVIKYQNILEPSVKSMSR